MMSIFKATALTVTFLILQSSVALASTPSEIINKIFKRNKTEKTVKPTAPEKQGQAQVKVADDKTIIGNVFASNATPFNIVLIDKKAKTLYLASLESDTLKTTKTFPALFGAKDGDKAVQGDQKTPEGVYYITSYKSEEDLKRQFGNSATVYGTGAFPLNYPNPVDKMRAKTGGGIWLHGIGVNDKNATNGCVAVENKYLDELKSYLPKLTPVIVSNSIIMQSAEEYQKDKQKYLDFLNSFIALGKAKDTESFSKLIHKDFNSIKSGSRSSYISEYGQKPALTDYTVSDIKIFRHNGADILYDFDISSCANDISSVNNIRYYFSLDAEGAIQLLSEEILPANIGKALEDSVLFFIAAWAESWNSKDINRFKTHYSKEFKAGRTSYAQFIKNKEDVFRVGGDINIKISDISWKNENGYIVATFIQNYSSPHLKSTGKKMLTLKGCIGNLKIISEKWSDK